MRKIIILLPIFFFIGCVQHKLVEYVNKNGELTVRQIFPDSRDTLNYTVYQYYKTGELQYKAHIIKGQIEGAYWIFSPKGSIIERGNYHNGKRDGVFQVYDTNGVLITEKYYINDVKVLYSECYESEKEHFFKQEFAKMKNDSIGISIGQIVKENDVIRPDMSFYSLIIANDTINSLSYCFKLLLMNKGSKNSKYNVIFGVPDSNLIINEIDTSFTTSDSWIKICNYKFHPGTNHVFCKVVAYSVDAADTATFYVYKDVFVKPKK